MTIGLRGRAQFPAVQPDRANLSICTFRRATLLAFLAKQLARAIQKRVLGSQMLNARLPSWVRRRRTDSTLNPS
jgi:hypothetical protein